MLPKTITTEVATDVLARIYASHLTVAAEGLTEEHFSAASRMAIMAAAFAATYEAVDDLSAMGTTAFQFDWPTEKNDHRALPEWRVARASAFAATMALFRLAMEAEGTAASRPRGPTGPCLENIVIIGLADALAAADQDWEFWVKYAARYGPKMAHHPVHYPTLSLARTIDEGWVARRKREAGI